MQRPSPAAPPSAGRRRPVVLTVGNWMYREHLANFACNLQRISVSLRPLVYALDRRTHELSAQLGLASVLVSDLGGEDGEPGEFNRTGMRSFGAITKSKLVATLEALQAGLDVLVSDADVHWCVDAVQAVLEIGGVYGEADVIVQAERGYQGLNSGFFYVRGGERAVRLFERVVENIEVGMHDQDVINSVFCEEEFGGKKIDENGEVGFRCENGDAVIRVLPVEQFPSGGEMFEGKGIFERGREELGAMCREGRFVIVHNNFIRANKKKARFVQKGMWFVEFRKKGNQVGVQCLKKAVNSSERMKRTCGRYC